MKDKKFSILGRTKGGSPQMIIQNPKLFNDLITSMDGNITITIERIIDEGTNLQKWHFRKTIVPLVKSLSTRSGNNLTEEETELLVLHEVCKVPIEKDLESLNKEQLSLVIDVSKRWINEFFADLSETGNKLI